MFNALELLEMGAIVNSFITTSTKSKLNVKTIFKYTGLFVLVTGSKYQLPLKNGDTEPSNIAGYSMHGVCIPTVNSV